MLKRIIACTMLLTLFLLCVTSAAAGGTVTDPVVTYSYVTQTFKPQILSQSQSLIEKAFAELSTQLDQKFGTYGIRAGLYAAAYLRHTDITVSEDGKPAAFTVDKDTIISGALGTMITLTNGSANIYTPNGDVIVNITDGEAYLHGNAVIPLNTYMIADEGQIGIRVTSESTVIVSGNYYIVGNSVTHEELPTIDPNNYTAQYTKYAHALNVLGLFKGTNNGFELERSANRAEAVTMLIRILGEEQQALAYTGTHPFTDVPVWADRYVAYAYNMGYTNGISETKFGAANAISETQYLTFLLRALGYSDASGDFVWNEANTAAVSYGLLTASEERAMRTVFFRDQMVFTSYKALYTNMKDTTTPLYAKLLSANAIKIDDLYQADLIVG